MSYKYNFISVVFLFCSLFFIQTSKAQQASFDLQKAIPQVEEKLNSEDLKERIKVLNQLVVYKWDFDITKTVLPFNLSAEDYAYVIRKILEKDLAGLETKIASETLSRVEFLIINFQLKQFTKNLVEYIPKFKPDATDLHRISIQYGILGTLRRLKAVEFAPQIATLLQPFVRGLYEEALSTLIEFRSKYAVPALLSLLYDKDPYKRGFALQNLAKVNARESASQIAKFLKDETESNRYGALDALVKLNAKEHAPKIWSLVDSGQDLNTENYALAALAHFGEERAIPMIMTLITTNLERGSTILERLGELKGKAVAPALINLLQREDTFIGLGENANIRNHIISCLRKLEARESIPVLMSYLNNERLHYHFLDNVATTLGDLRAKEATDDLLRVLDQLRYDYKGEANNKTYDVASTAVALAKIGDKKAWKKLIDVVGNPNFPLSSQVIVELNQHLDADLWQKSQEIKLPVRQDRQRIVSIKELAEIYSRETKIRLFYILNRAKILLKGSRSPHLTKIPRVILGHTSTKTPLCSAVCAKFPELSATERCRRISLLFSTTNKYIF
jgi:HEAT repeat protein